jgi:small subunit ribosomal protein S2
MTDVQLKDLLEAGVHFGHQTKRWNPKMRKFIFAERSGIYLIDLQKTLRQLKAAQELVRQAVLNGEGVLFVCTKKQLKQVIRIEAERCGANWVTERWLGGMLTNFNTIKKQVRRLKELEQGQADGAFEFFTKKEQLMLDRERIKLNRNLEGIKSMGRLPGVIFVVDSRKERIAIAEANKLGIPVIAIVDTNSDPDLLTVPIPGNDDAIRSVSLIAGALVETVAGARREAPVKESAEPEDASTYSSGAGTEADNDDQTKRRHARRKRRPKPEAIVARLKDEPATPASPSSDDASAPAVEVAGAAEEPNSA